MECSLRPPCIATVTHDACHDPRGRSSEGVIILTAFETHNPQKKRPGGSDLALGGGITEIIDCNERSHLT